MAATVRLATALLCMGYLIGSVACQSESTSTESVQLTTAVILNEALTTANISTDNSSLRNFTSDIADHQNATLTSATSSTWTTAALNSQTVTVGSDISMTQQTSHGVTEAVSASVTSDPANTLIPTISHTPTDITTAPAVVPTTTTAASASVNASDTSSANSWENATASNVTNTTFTENGALTTTAAVAGVTTTIIPNSATLATPPTSSANVTDLSSTVSQDNTSQTDVPPITTQMMNSTLFDHFNDSTTAAPNANSSSTVELYDSTTPDMNTTSAASPVTSGSMTSESFTSADTTTTAASVATPTATSSHSVTNSSDAVSRRFSVLLRINSINWTDAYADNTTEAYRDLKNNITAWLNETFMNWTSYDGSEVKKFSQGSVVANVESSFSDQNVTVLQVQEAIIRAADTTTWAMNVTVQDLQSSTSENLTAVSSTVSTLTTLQDTTTKVTQKEASMPSSITTGSSFATHENTTDVTTSSTPMTYESTTDVTTGSTPMTHESNSVSTTMETVNVTSFSNQSTGMTTSGGINENVTHVTETHAPLENTTSSPTTTNPGIVTNLINTTTSESVSDSVPTRSNDNTTSMPLNASTDNLATSNTTALHTTAIPNNLTDVTSFVTFENVTGVTTAFVNNVTEFSTTQLGNMTFITDSTTSSMMTRGTTVTLTTGGIKMFSFGLRISNLEWQDDLRNSSSTASLILKENLTLWLNESLRNFTSYKGSEVTSFSQGSVVANIELSFSDLGVTEQQVANALIQAEDFPSWTIDKTNLTVKEIEHYTSLSSTTLTTLSSLSDATTSANQVSTEESTRSQSSTTTSMTLNAESSTAGNVTSQPQTVTFDNSVTTENLTTSMNLITTTVHTPENVTHGSTTTVYVNVTDLMNTTSGDVTHITTPPSYLNSSDFTTKAAENSTIISEGSNATLHFTTASSVTTTRGSSKTFKINLRITSLDWQEDFKNNSSTAYTILRDNITSWLNESFANLTSYERSDITSFSQGSVVVNFESHFYDSSVTEGQVLDALRRAPDFQMWKIDRENITAKESEQYTPVSSTIQTTPTISSETTTVTPPPTTTTTETVEIHANTTTSATISHDNFTVTTSSSGHPTTTFSTANVTFDNSVTTESLTTSMNLITTTTAPTPENVTHGSTTTVYVNVTDLTNTTSGNVTHITTPPSYLNSSDFTTEATENSTIISEGSNTTLHFTTATSVTPASRSLKTFNIRLRITNLDWQDDYKSNSSDAYRSLSNNITLWLNESLSNITSYMRSEITSFSQGSIVASIQSSFSDPSVTEPQVLDALRGAPEFSFWTIDRVNLTVQDLEQSSSVTPTMLTTVSTLSDITTSTTHTTEVTTGTPSNTTPSTTFSHDNSTVPSSVGINVTQVTTSPPHNVTSDITATPENVTSTSTLTITTVSFVNATDLMNTTGGNVTYHTTTLSTVNSTDYTTDVSLENATMVMNITSAEITMTPHTTFYDNVTEHNTSESTTPLMSTTSTLDNTTSSGPKIFNIQLRITGINWTDEYNSNTSDSFVTLRDNFTSWLQLAFKNLSYEGSNITQLRPGSVIIDFTSSFSDPLITKQEVLNALRSAPVFNLGSVDNSSISAEEVSETTSKPTPETTTHVTPSSTTTAGAGSYETTTTTPMVHNSTTTPSSNQTTSWLNSTDNSTYSHLVTTVSTLVTTGALNTTEIYNNVTSGVDTVSTVNVTVTTVNVTETTVNSTFGPTTSLPENTTETTTNVTVTTVNVTVTTVNVTDATANVTETTVNVTISTISSTDSSTSSFPENVTSPTINFTDPTINTTGSTSTTTASTPAPPSATKIIEGQIVITNGTEWNENLKNLGSSEAILLINELVKELTDLYGHIPGFYQVLIIDLRQGSVKVTYWVLFNDTAVTADVVEKTLKDHLQSSNFTLGNFTIDITQIKHEVKPSRSTDTEEKFPDWAIAVIVCGGCLLIFVLFLIIILCCRRSTNKKYTIKDDPEDFQYRRSWASQDTSSVPSQKDDIYDNAGSDHYNKPQHKVNDGRGIALEDSTAGANHNSKIGQVNYGFSDPVYNGYETVDLNGHSPDSGQKANGEAKKSIVYKDQDTTTFYDISNEAWETRL